MNSNSYDPMFASRPRGGRAGKIVPVGVALVVASMSLFARGADVDNMYDVSLSTTGQSVWGPGTTAAPNGGTMNIVNITWPNTNVGFDAITSFTIPDECLDLSAACEDACGVVKDACYAGCEVAGGCIGGGGCTLCASESTCKNCKSDCRDVRDDCKSGCAGLKTCLSDLFPDLVGVTFRFGADVSFRTRGNMGMRFNTTDMVRTTDVNYTGDASIVSPSANSFYAGDTLILDTAFLADNAAELLSPVPTDGSLALDALWGFYVRAEAEFCIFDCVAPPVLEIDTFENGNPPVDQLLEIGPEKFCLSTWPEVGDPNTGSICQSASSPLPPGFSFISGIKGYWMLPAVVVTSAIDLLNPNKLKASGEQEFMELSLDLDKWLTRLVSVKVAGIPFPDASISFETAFIGIDFLDWDFRIHTILQHLFSFEPVVQVTLAFPQPISYQILSSGGNPIGAVQTGATVVLNAGQKLQISGPSVPTDVVPTFAIKNAANFSNATETHVDFNMALRLLFGGLVVPAFAISPGTCAPDPFGDLCLPTLSFGGLDASVGPAFQQEWTLTTLVDRDDLDGNRAPWSLQGFNTQQGALFVLDPEQPPVVDATNSVVTVNEGALAQNTGSATDPEGNTIALTVEFIGTVVNNNDETWDWSYQTTDGPANGQTVTITGDDGNLGTDTTVFELVVNNVAPAVTATPASQSVQYSDTIETIMISADDVAVDTLTASTTYSFDAGAATNGLPTGLTLNVGSCTVSGVFHTCGWSITGEALVPQGTYDIEVTITDKDGGHQAKTVTLNVAPEDGVMAFDGSNPPVVQVETDGGDSPSFVLRLYVQELVPDAVLGNSAAAPGDIGEAVVEMSLVPVGPGGTETVLCTPVNDPAAFDYDGVLTVDCAFDGVSVKV